MAALIVSLVLGRTSKPLDHWYGASASRAVPVTHQLSLVLINRPRRDGTSWRWYTAAATGGIRTYDLAVARPPPYHSSGRVTRTLAIVAKQHSAVFEILGSKCIGITASPFGVTWRHRSPSARGRQTRLGLEKQAIFDLNASLGSCIWAFDWHQDR